MKIVHLSDYYKSTLGYQMYYLCKYHQKAGHEVSIITSDRYFPFDNYEEIFEDLVGPRFIGAGKFFEDGIPVYRLPVFFEIKTVLLMKGLYKALKDVDPDLVFMHNMFGITPLLAALFKKRLGYKLIYDTHVAGFNSDFNSTLVRRLYYNLFIKKTSAPLVRKRADKIFAVGEAEREFVCKSFGFTKEDVSIPRVGVDVNRFKPNPKIKDTFKEKLDIKNDEEIILYTGKIQKEKEVDMLIKLIAKLEKKNRSKVKLLLLGNADKKLESQLEELIDELGIGKRVVWLGMVPHKEVSKYYQVAEIGIWPGNASLARFEAMSSGVPLILPFWEGNNEIIDSGAALGFERGDIEDLTKKTTSLLKSREKREKMSKKARDYVKKHYSWKKISKEMIKL